MRKPSTIDEYIEAFHSDVQNILHQIRTLIQQTAPEAEEAIKYGIPTFVFAGKNLVHFGAFKHHIGFYPTPVGIEEFQAELSQYKSSKGSVQFPFTKPVPFDLVRRIVLFNTNKNINKTNKNNSKNKTQIRRLSAFLYKLCRLSFYQILARKLSGVYILLPGLTLNAS